MRDESIRELERATTLAPDDPGARVRLAAALARSGRRREALDQLDALERLGPAPAEARRLADGLWREAIADLDRSLAVKGAHDVSDVVIDATGRTVVWTSNAGTLSIADTTTGETVWQAAYRPVGRLFAHARRIFALVHMYVARETQAYLLEVSLDPKPEVRRLRVSPATRLLGVSPTGDRLFLQNEEYDGVYEWPTLAPVVRRPCRGVQNAIVDWESNHLVAFELGGRSVEVCPIARGDVPGAKLAIAGRRGTLEGIGQGLLAQTAPGLTLHALGRGWSLPLIPSLGSFPVPQIARNGRRARLLLAGTPVRFDVDLEKGEVLGKPPALDRLVRSHRSGEEHVAWHPRADLAFVRSGRSFFELRGTDGVTLRPLPADSYPQGWTADGHALLVLRGAGGGLGQVWLELWRVR